MKSNNEVAKVKIGDKIKIEYEGSLDDGTVFDCSADHDSPLEFEVGGKQVIKGFDDAVLGMKKGEEKKFRLIPSEAYGEANPELVKEVPRDRLPPQELKPGMMIGVGLANGGQIPAVITKVTLEQVTIDLNHPLAGKALNFKIKVLEIN